MAVYPITSSEQLLYSTVMIKTSSGSGTGFFFTFDIDEKTQVPVIITNKHVVNYKTTEVVEFNFHTGNAIEKRIDDTSISVKLNLEWIHHPIHDICFTYFRPIGDFVNHKFSKTIFHVALSTKDMYLPDQLNKLSAVEDVVMVGYPIGLWDKKNNLPLFRRGITASHPAIDFNEESTGVVDMACFPGSSGSPIFIDNINGYHDKEKNRFMLGTKRSIFLGILFSGPVFKADGTIKVVSIPTSNTLVSTTPLMINLGYYIKAHKILDFTEYIKQRLEQHPPAQNV